jgi:hypothetical protein
VELAAEERTVTQATQAPAKPAAKKAAKAAKAAKGKGGATPATPRKPGGKATKGKATKGKATKGKAKGGRGKGGGTAVATKPAAKKAAPQAATNGKPAPGAPYAEWLEYRRKHPLTITDRGPGVMRTIVDELKRAGKGANPKGITKKEMLEILKLRFPDRDPLKMDTNLNNIIPGRLRREYGLLVWRRKTDDGQVAYYLYGDGRTPQATKN